jgi:hypothetical protein
MAKTLAGSAQSLLHHRNLLSSAGITRILGIHVHRPHADLRQMEYGFYLWPQLTIRITRDHFAADDHSAFWLSLRHSEPVPRSDLHLIRNGACLSL